MGERGKGRGEAAARGDAERSGSAEGVVGRVKAFNAGIRWGGGEAGADPLYQGPAAEGRSVLGEQSNHGSNSGDCYEGRVQCRTRP